MTTVETRLVDISAWHPKLQWLWNYWRSIHPAAGLPGRQHLDPAAIMGLLPNLWLVDVQQEPLRFRYRLVGTRLTQMVGWELSGHWFDEAHPHTRTDPTVLAPYAEVVRTKQPTWRKGKPMLYLTHKDFTVIERALLPLARDGETVDMLMTLSLFHLDATTVI